MIAAFLALAAQVPDRLPRARALPPPSADEQSVLAPINALFAAFEAGNSEAMLRLVYPQGRVTATGARSSGTGLRSLSWVEFAQRVTPGTPFSERISDPAIEIDGDVAMVWAPFVVRIKGKATNCGFDHFDLVRENGTWKVMNLTFSSRVTGCPAQ